MNEVTRRMPPFILLLAAAALAAAGCGSTCVEGRSEGCACGPTGAQVGVRTCGPSGELGGCVCPDGVDGDGGPRDGDDAGPRDDGETCDELASRCDECDPESEDAQLCWEAAENGDQDTCARVAGDLDCASRTDCERELASRCEELDCGFGPEVEATVMEYCEGLPSLGECDAAIASLDYICDDGEGIRCANLARRCGNECIHLDICEPGSGIVSAGSCQATVRELERECWIGETDDPVVEPGEGTCRESLECVARCLPDFDDAARYQRCLEDCSIAASTNAADAANALAACVRPRCGGGCNITDFFDRSMRCHGCVLGEIRDDLAEGADECLAQLDGCGL